MSLRSCLQRAGGFLIVALLVAVMVVFVLGTGGKW